jgi:ADP-ribose pyrophosphatase YjhB (NUDIX family)
MTHKHAYCGYCGTRFPENLAFPRLCASCANITYLNPLPVAVLLLPVDEGLLTVRRAIEPGRGQLALPGGFINLGESWQEAAVRELEEETGVCIDADEVRDFHVYSASDGTVLIFGLANQRRADELPSFRLSDETAEVTVIYEPTPLAFQLHTRVVAEYFERRANGALP